MPSDETALQAEVQYFFIIGTVGLKVKTTVYHFTLLLVKLEGSCI